MDSFNIEHHIDLKANTNFSSKDSCKKLLNTLTVPCIELAKSLIKLHDDEQRIVLFETDRVELVLCTWYEKSKRPWHTHPGTSCYFKCLFGKLTEIREQVDLTHESGQISFIDDSLGGHRVKNAGINPAASLHIYVKK
jgi:hypothetical protein